MKEKWVRATSVDQFKVGCGVRFRDRCEREWQNNDRVLCEDGMVRPVCKDSAGCEWTPGDLLESWEIVEVNTGRVMPEEAVGLLMRCPDLPDDRSEYNPDAIKAFTEAFLPWKQSVKDLIEKAKG